MTQQKNTRRPNGSGSEWRNDNGVWHAKKSAGVNPRTGRRRWKRSLEDAGLPYVTIRSARHFFSTHLAEARAPEDARKAMMGHAKISTTAGYAHWSAASLAALADKARQAVSEPA